MPAIIIRASTANPANISIIPIYTVPAGVVLYVQKISMLVFNPTGPGFCLELATFLNGSSAGAMIDSCTPPLLTNQSYQVTEYFDDYPLPGTTVIDQYVQYTMPAMQNLTTIITGYTLE